METFDKVTISEAGWHLVADKKGYITCNCWGVEFAYSSTEPEDSFRGEKSTQRSIGNDDNSNLWIKVKNGMSITYNKV